ncbi:hypothetical protein BG006_001162 [Podila minutissima]|uniref:Crinkler effector protein N-terminal domain-containing protein n=1 Tax=Podila minutissima TaxID=64525 RepID=A0A9P5VH92_9FUNG|nr:hypothetical protein BG006_001162 [Podila minutissima]
MIESDDMDIDVTPNNIHHNDNDDFGTNNDDDDVRTNNDDDLGTNNENEKEVNNREDNEVDPGRSMLEAEIRLYHLKTLIKAEKTNDFSDVDADKLTIWRVTIPIADDDNEIPIQLHNVATEDKKKLGPATRLSKVFSGDLPEETIHIIVQRPPSATSAELFPSVAVFTVTVKGRTPATLQWITDTATATLDELRGEIHAKHPSLYNPSLNNGLRTVAIDKSDCSTVLYLESDEELRVHLRTMLRDGVQHIPVRLEGRPRPFSEFDSTETDRIYGSKSHAYVGALKCVGSAGSTPLTSPDHIQALSDLLVMLRSTVKVMWAGKSVVPERGYSSYVFVFLVHAVRLFPELILTPNKFISGRRGSGTVDWAIVSKDDPSRILAVTTSGLMEGNSLQQNMVQLDTISSGRKRKFEDDSNDTVPVVSYGIVSDATSWSFLECNTDMLHESGYNDPTFIFTQSTTILQFSDNADDWETRAKKIFGHIIWQLQKMVDDLPTKNKRPKTDASK